MVYIYYSEYLPTRTWQGTMLSVKPEYDEASFNCGFVCRAQTKELLWAAVGRPGSGALSRIKMHVGGLR